MVERARPSPKHFRRLVYWLAISIGVNFGAIMYGTSVLITSHAAGSEYSVTLLSLAYSGSVLTGAVVAVSVGRHADRHGIRFLTATGGILVGVGFITFSFSTREWHILAAWWVLIGPGSSMVLFEPAFVAIQQWFPRTLRNRAAALLTVVVGLTGPAFIPATAWMVDQFNWRWTAVILGMSAVSVALITAGWALRVAPTYPHTWVNNYPSEPPSHRGTASSDDHRHQNFRGFLTITVSVTLAIGVMDTFNVHRISRFEATGFDTATLGWWAGLVGLLSLPARFFLPTLANRYTPLPLWILMVILVMPAVWLTIRGTENWEMIGHFVIFGLLFGTFMPLRAVIMSDWYSGPQFGRLMGLQAVAIAAGRAGGPALIGWLSETSAGYPTGMVLLSAAMFLSLITALIAGKQRK
ncbi:MFS transporter [Nesterenkonia ebinurensis]|uniref:MFS transporter n=1 Tax=Nesterenkonia ebinurensis TaxID=2608252 RepID=UPI00123D5F66|nr:MFS transporter [Nesterenkonia ebinurensis]